jgi:hypothetical protein
MASRYAPEKPSSDREANPLPSDYAEKFILKAKSHGIIVSKSPTKVSVTAGNAGNKQLAVPKVISNPFSLTSSDCTPREYSDLYSDSSEDPFEVSTPGKLPSSSCVSFPPLFNAFYFIVYAPIA